MLLEERLQGREISVFAIGDGTRLVPVAAACDYKRARDGDTGPNTGGMGAYSPPAGFPDDLLAIVAERILTPVARGLLAEGERYVGVLYCGLMWTAHGPTVIEFNVRFGDPETQALVPRIRGDFARLLASAAAGDCDVETARFDGDPCVAIVLATANYPHAATPLTGASADTQCAGAGPAFWGASTLRDGCVDSTGGRVLTVTASAASLADARRQAYAAVEKLSERIGARGQLLFRRDIAADAVAV